jgi:peptidoglycan lytic transglycosylase
MRKTHVIVRFIGLLLVCAVFHCPTAIAAEDREIESGTASVYAYAGSRTASGEIARSRGLTAAHRTLSFGTKVKVTNKRNGRSVMVRINDRGPFIKGRIIDVTPMAAEALGFFRLAPVTLSVID